MASITTPAPDTADPNSRRLAILALALLDEGKGDADGMHIDSDADDNNPSEDEDAKPGFHVGLRLSLDESKGDGPLILPNKASHKSHIASLLAWLLAMRE